jgi:phage baseplate assembly protein W
MPNADYQVLSFRDAASLTKIDVFSYDPYTLDIHGEHFKAVSEVLINGERAPEFIVLSPRRLLAEVPRRQAKAQIRTVRVLLSRHGVTETSMLALKAVVPGARATGFTRLMQSYMRILFTDPGTDIQNPTLGGGLGRLLGSAGDTGELRTTASQAVQRAEEHLTRIQARALGLLAAEKLQSVTLLSAEYNAATTAVSIKIRITAMDGSTFEPVVSV